MKWNHLPEPGGLYQQNPQLLDRFYYIFAERSKAQEAERKKQEAQMGKGAGGKRGSSRPSARR